MFVEHRAAGQARPRAVRAPPGERAHPLSVPRRSGALAQQHRGEVVPVVERQVPFRVDQRIGGIGDEQNLAAGDERFADRGRQPRREQDLGVAPRLAARFGQPIAASALEAAPSMGNSDGAAPASGGTTQSSSVLRERTRPLPSRASSLERNDGDRVTALGGERNRRRIGSKRGLAALIGETPHEPRALRRLGGAGEPHGNLEALAGANSGARRPRDDEPRPLQFGQPSRRRRAGGSERP